ncbi:hypothetical protein KA005_51220 [bacterium]|nr:hypothetical protein [bacterium]
MDDRSELLLRMYDQLFNDINRHIMVVWQSIGTVVGAFAVFALVEKSVITLDIAASLIILLCAWLIAHLFDAAYWYNRNLAMIANIERQFLDKDDLKLIHYYFGKHRPINSMLTHLRIQFWLGTGLSLTVLLFHFSQRVMPGIGQPISNFELSRSMPYLILSLSIGFLVWLKKQRAKSYQEFIKNSPGKEIDTSGIEYGVGHGFKADDSNESA